MRDVEVERRVAAPLVARADQLSRQQRQEDAVSLLEEAVTRHPTNVRLLTELGKHLRYAMRPDASIARLRQALEWDAEDRDALFQLGRTQANDAHAPEAMETHLCLMQLYPDDEMLRVELALDEIELGAPEKALPDLLRMHEARPDAFELRYALALALSKAGRYTEAIVHLEQLVDRTPNYFLGWAALAEAYSGLVRTSEWQHAVERAWSISSRGAVSHRLRGDLLFMEGRFDDAQAMYERALAIHPRHYRAHLALGNLEANRGRTQEAANHFAAALAIAPWDGTVQGNWAQFHERNGRRLDLDSLGVAAHDVPRSRLSLSLARIWYYTRHDVSRAKEWLTFTVEHLPEEVQALVELSRVCLESGDAASALRWNERAVALSPAHGGAWYGLAHAAARTGDVDRALVAFAKAAELHPGEASVHQGYGLALLSVGRVEDAALELQRAVDLAPNHGLYAFTLALGLERAGRLDEARLAADRARARLPADHPGLADLLTRLGM